MDGIGDDGIGGGLVEGEGLVEVLLEVLEALLFFVGGLGLGLGEEPGDGGSGFLFDAGDGFGRLGAGAGVELGGLVMGVLDALAGEVLGVEQIAEGLADDRVMGAGRGVQDHFGGWGVRTPSLASRRWAMVLTAAVGSMASVLRTTS